MARPLDVKKFVLLRLPRFLPHCFCLVHHPYLMAIGTEPYKIAPYYAISFRLPAYLQEKLCSVNYWNVYDRNYVYSTLVGPNREDILILVWHNIVLTTYRLLTFL